ARLIGDPGGGLALLPLPSIDDQDLVVAVILDAPHTDDADKRFRLRANGLVRKVDFQRLCRVGACQNCREADASDGNYRGALARFHPWPPFLFGCSNRVMVLHRICHTQSCSLAAVAVVKNRNSASGLDLAQGRSAASKTCSRVLLRLARESRPQARYLP